MSKEKDSKVEEIVDVDLKKAAGNIEEQLDKETALNKEAVSAAAKSMEKKRKEITEAEAERALYQSEYLQKMQQLWIQRIRREVHASKVYLDTIGGNGLHKDLLDGKLLPREFDKKIDEAKKVKNNAYNVARDRFNDQWSNIKKLYAGYWYMGWDDPTWRSY